MSDFVYDLIGLAAGVLFILALKGLSHPRTARRGNLLGALGAGIATVVVFFHGEIENLGWILGAIAVGTIIGRLQFLHHVRQGVLHVALFADVKVL
jgi:NAD(P) transhydrogenase subunit beta